MQLKIYENPLKADRPHSCNYPHTPNDYRHTDKHLRDDTQIWVLFYLDIELCTASLRGGTDGRTEATKYIISLASWSINKSLYPQKNP